MGFFSFQQLSTAFNSFQQLSTWPKNPPSIPWPFQNPPGAPLNGRPGAVSDLLAVSRHRAADPQEVHQGALLRRTLHRREGFEDPEVRMVAGAVEQLQGTWKDRIL